MRPEEGRILLIEDNPSDAELILHVLRKCALAHYVHVLQDGDAALTYLFHPHNRPVHHPEMIILDLKLPKVNGVEVLQQLRAHAETAGIPVVIFSSSSELRDIQEGQRYKVERYLVKPVNYSAFKEKIEQIAQYWRQLADQHTAMD